MRIAVAIMKISPGIVLCNKNSFFFEIKFGNLTVLSIFVPFNN
jgi:hypothetical protein